MIDDAEMTAVYKAAFDDLRRRHGVDAALSAAAATAAYYCLAASSGLTRRREPVLIVPAEIETGENENDDAP